jgi:hypothetical protein
MKNLKSMTITLMMCFLSLMSFAQDAKEKQLSNAEIFSAKAGTLIEKQFIDVGKCKSVEVKVLKLKDLNDGTGFSALRLEYEYVSSYSTDTKIASLDKDEIDGLIKSIRNLQTNVFTSTRDVYTEVTFKSRTGFECGAYYEVGKGIWKAYMQLEKYDSKSNVFLNVEELSTFLSLVEQAKLKM